MKETQPLAEPDQAGTDDAGPKLQPPRSRTRWLAERSWWVPWLLGAAVVAVGVATLVPLVSGSSGATNGTARLPSSKHTVVYQVDGTGDAPEIRYLVDGIAASETVDKVNLPWRKELTLTVGPGLGIAQILANNGEYGDQITCSISVDGVVVNKNTAPGKRATVGCSAMIRP